MIEIKTTTEIFRLRQSGQINIPEKKWICKESLVNHYFDWYKKTKSNELKWFIIGELYNLGYEIKGKELEKK